MGERSFADQASDDEKKKMAEIVGKAVDAGAIGFSTNRFAPHKAPDGRSIPGTFADASELVEIGKAVAQRNGLMQAVGATADVLRAITDQSKSRVLFSYGVSGDKGAGRKSAEGLDKLCEGRDLTAISQVKGTGFMFGLQCSLPFRGESWEKIRGLDLAGRLAAIRDPEIADKLVREGETRFAFEHTYYIGDGETPNLTAPRNQSVKDELAKTRRDVSSNISCASRARRTVARSSTIASSAPTWTNSAICLPARAMCFRALAMPARMSRRSSTPIGRRSRSSTG